MKKRRAIAEVEGRLIWFMVRIGIEQREHEGLFDSDCQKVHEEIEAAKTPLQELGMYDELVAMLERARRLGHQGRYDDANALVYHVHQKMMRKSGSLQRLEQRFGAVTPAEARVPRLGDLVHGFGPPEPDTYQGRFFERATAGEIEKVVTVAAQVRNLATVFAMVVAGREKDVDQYLARVTTASAAAEEPLKKLGLYRMLDQTFEAARSFCAEKDYAAAEELVEELSGYLQERLNVAAISKPSVQ